MAAPGTPRGTPRDMKALVGRGWLGCDMGNPRGEAKLFPCSEPRGGCGARCPQGLVAQLRPEVTPPAAFPHGHGARRAGAYTVHSVWGVPADPSSPQGPFVSPRAVLVTTLRPPPTPLGNLQPHLSPQTQTISSCRAKRHRWDGGSGSSDAARLLGGTSVGDVPTVPESPCPLHQPPLL